MGQKGLSKEIIKEIFKSQTIFYYTLVGQTRIEDKEIEDGVINTIPKSLHNYKYLFRPIRHSLVKLLYENLEFTSVDLKDILDISWNEYYNNVYSLEKKGYVHIQDKFVDGSKKTSINYSTKGN